jgi:DNA polymerase-3 subunit epsilon
MTKKNLIYIGKSRNIKKDLISISREQTQNQKKIQALVFRVTYEETGSELIALLKESEEIKINKPLLNRAQRKVFFSGLYSELDKNGYLNLKLQKQMAEKSNFLSTLQEGKMHSLESLLNTSYVKIYRFISNK